MWQDLQDLQKDIEELKHQAKSLGTRMQDVGVQLRNGLINPERDILISLEHYLKSYKQIKSLLGVDSQYDSHGKLIPESVMTLESALLKKQSQKDARDVIDNVLSLCHDQMASFAPLDQFKHKVEEVKVQINTGNITVSESQERVREYKLLLRLVNEADQLTDEEWTTLMDDAVRIFGRPLATAAARGHLGMLVA